MVSFDLPATTTEQPPAFVTAAECGVWIEAQAASPPVLMQAALLRQLNLLNRYRLPATERLAILELLRGPVHATQEDNVRRFTGKPLPFAAPEQAAFDTCMSIWNALANGYLHCIAGCMANEPGTAMSRALVCQRALASLVSAQFDACRGGHLSPASHWRKLHRAYVSAEEAAVAQHEVTDALRIGRTPTTPLATWSEALLLQTASLVELPPRQMLWAARWAKRWAGKLKVHKSPPTMSARAIPLCVDLDSDKAAGYIPMFTPGARYLDTSALRTSLKGRVVALEKGESPKKLQLGDDCVQPLCQQLLIEMYYHWCKGGALRKHDRHDASGLCTVIGELEAIHYYLSGRKPFALPAKALSDTDIRRQRDEIGTFGRLIDTKVENYSEQHGYHMEQWEVMEHWNMVNQSVGGLRILRPPGHEGSRFSSSQLVAVKPDGATDLMLGMLRWVVVDATGALQSGVEIIAGKPQAVAVRGTGLDAVGDNYAPAFLLPEIPSLGEPPSIITPPGFFRLERLVDLFEGSSSQIRLTAILERGSDFERSTYQ